MFPLLSADLSTRHLRAVLAVAEYRSFIAAASHLRLSQPALTRIIKQVEQAAGTELFSRTTRQVSVTAAGREFAAMAERTLHDLALSLTSVRQHSGHGGQVIIASVLSLASAVMPASIAGFTRTFPNVQIHLREGLHRDVLDDVRGGVADFGISYIDENHQDLVTEDLGREPLHVVFRRNDPRARATRIRLADIVNDPFVSFPRESRTRQLVDAAAARLGYSLKYAVTANRLPTVLSLVRNGVGLAVVPVSESPPASDRALTSRPLAGAQFSSRGGILRLRERALSPAAAALLPLVKARFKAGG